MKIAEDPLFSFVSRVEVLRGLNNLNINVVFEFVWMIPFIGLSVVHEIKNVVTYQNFIFWVVKWVRLKIMSYIIKITYIGGIEAS